MKIVEYNESFSEDVKDLLFELQKYISEIDREKYNIITSECREKYFSEVLSEVKKYQGKIFLAVEKEKAVGVVIGTIMDKEISYNFKAPKRGFVKDLIVTKNKRSLGYGKILLEKIENYFKEEGCEAVRLDVFAYNENAIKFYSKNDYFSRVLELQKNI